MQKLDLLVLKHLRCPAQTHRSVILYFSLKIRARFRVSPLLAFQLLHFRSCSHLVFALAHHLLLADTRHFSVAPCKSKPC